jgi:hypothetical protein
MEKYQQLREAMKLFGLGEHETMGEIKRKINTQIKKWHPDHCKENKELCKEKSITLIKAKNIIMDYCEHYKISFTVNEIEKYLTPEEFWTHRFGKDPLWGNNNFK